MSSHNSSSPQKRRPLTHILTPASQNKWTTVNCSKQKNKDRKMPTNNEAQTGKMSKTIQKASFRTSKKLGHHNNADNAGLCTCNRLNTSIKAGSRGALVQPEQLKQCSRRGWVVSQWWKTNPEIPVSWVQSHIRWGSMQGTSNLVWILSLPFVLKSGWANNTNNVCSVREQTCEFQRWTSGGGRDLLNVQSVSLPKEQRLEDSPDVGMSPMLAHDVRRIFLSRDMGEDNASSGN